MPASGTQGKPGVDSMGSACSAWLGAPIELMWSPPEGEAGQTNREEHRCTRLRGAAPPSVAGSRSRSMRAKGNVRSSWALMATCAGLALSLACRSSEPAPTPPSGVLVAHALGGIDGLTYTNSLEALRCNHARGYRWFEVDLSETRDHEIVAFHPGLESRLGLDRPVHEVPFSALRQARFKGKYPLATFREVLSEARSLGGVVLVTDTKAWQPSMLAGVRQTLKDTLDGGSEPRIVLQSYGEGDVDAVAELAREVGGGVILTLYKTQAGDQAVVDMAKQHGVVAVTASRGRFTPWLADRLHAAQIPVLVHTVNEHEQVTQLVQAGADGFYTDSYLPYAAITTDRRRTLDCGAAEHSPAFRRPWLARDLASTPDQYRMSDCAKRKSGAVELTGCDNKAAITGPKLAVPPGAAVHVTLDVEGPTGGSYFWFQMDWRNASKEKRTKIRLEPNERRKVTRDAVLPDGSAGVDVRLGLFGPATSLIVHNLKVSMEPEPQAAQPAPTGPAALEAIDDAG